MNNKLTILSVIIAHLCVITGLVFVGGCRSSTGMEGEPNRRAFTGFPGESGASGYEASTATSIKQPAPAAQPAVVVNPPSAVNEPASAPGTETAPAAVAANEPPAPAPVSEATTAPAAPVGAGRTYTVKPNESLWIIAKREGVSIDDIIAANHLSKNAVLRPGPKLTIPAASGHKVSYGSSAHTTPKKEVAVSGDVYVVKSGDAVSIIARKLGTTSAALREANGLKGDSIRVGQKLVIPAGAKNKSAATSSASAESKKSAPAAVAAADAKKPATTTAPATTGGLREVPLMGGAAAPAPAAVPAESAPAPEAVEATSVSK
jgi:LysM repeat protein